MTRGDSRTQPHTHSISPNSAKLSKFLLILFVVALASIAYFFLTTEDSLGDPSDQFVVKEIPKIYSKLEVIDPEEREVFEGFKTSFLPPEEIQLARKTRGADWKFSTSDLIWGDVDLSEVHHKREKRKTASSLSIEQESLHQNPHGGEEEDGESEIEDYGSVETNEQYEDDENFKSVVHPDMHVDRGPLDDVVEQTRGQPELEEGEMGAAARLYKPVKSYTGIHAFWKGQGDRETIRHTQAQIMRQYMDAEADPCHDFYQYACGNWPVLNPIPADKAGYDTFEMLRENLDTVLRDLLEFKKDEDFPSKHVGPHLQIIDNFLSLTNPSPLDPDQIFIQNLPLNRPIQEYPKNFTTGQQKTSHTKPSLIINRIRRSSRKKNSPKKPYRKIKSKIQGYKEIKKKYKPISKHSIPNNLVKYKSPISRKHRDEMKSLQSRNIGRKLQGFQKKLIRSKREDTLNNGFYEVLPDFEKMIQPPDPSHGDATLKARFLFRSCMNHDILHKRGRQPLLDLLELLGGWPILDANWKPDKFDWLELMAKLRLYNNDILISEWVGPDIKNSDEFVIQFDQTSLGLPTRDYFLQDSNRVYLDAYKEYLFKVALLLGGEKKHVEESANHLIEFETKLAKITSAPEDRKNVSELYRRMPLQKLEELVPQIKWKRYLCVVMNRTVQSDETVVLFALSYVRHLVQLIKETDPSTLANYLLWRFVRHRVNNLDDHFQSAKQQFYFILFGREKAPPRWKNCISQVNSNMGMALGSMFVKKYFDETSKNDTLRMTREIQQSFRELLHITDWIDDETKTLAAHKVDAMMLRIGYPDFILNKEELDERYKEVKIDPDRYFENILNILQHLTKMEQSRLGQPVNKTLWNTAPAVVNAYYSRNKNQIMFPAGILQPPFYHRHFPRSLNYGGIGVVIGHEITHGFDDKGRLFDCDGNLHRWWSDSAIEAFHRRAQCLIDQYGQYVVPEVNMKLDGVNTQGENIADNGGVKQAFRAYVHWIDKHGVEGETLPGLNHTHTQLFFLNFAQVWCGAMRPEAMRNKLKTAVHSPGRFRVIGTLSNSHDFAREFQCPVGSPMNPSIKCTVW